MTTYYVSNINGSDSNSGGLFAPLRTIAQAINRSNPGDMVLIRGGVYKEQVGVSKIRLTVRAYENEDVTIDGGWLNGVPAYGSYPVSSEWDAMVNVSAPHAIVDGLHVRNSAARGVEVSATDCVVSNLTIRNTFGGGLILYRAHRALIQDVKILKASQTFLYMGQPWPDRNSIINGWPHTVAPVRTEDSVWRRVEIYEHEGEGFSGYTGIRTTWDSCRIVNGTKEMVYLNWSPGFRMFDSEIYFTNGFMPRYGAGSPRSLFFADEVEVEDRGRPNYGNTRDVEIYNNVFVGAHTSLRFSGSNLRSSNAENVLISNNTFIASPGTDVVVMDQPENTPAHPRTWSNIRIENNIFIGSVRSTVQSQAYKDAVQWQHNYWSETPPVWMRSGTDITGPILLVSTAVPMLIDEDSFSNHDSFDPADYHLTANSPAIDAGISNEVNVTDANGIVRGTSPDIGFHEYRQDTPFDVIMTVDFSLFPTLVAPGENLTLTNLSTINRGEIDTHLWEFRMVGDTAWELHSTDETPAPLALEKVGVYEIRLTCTDVESDQSKSQISKLEVGELIPIPNFGRWALLRYGIEPGNRIGVDS